MLKFRTYHINACLIVLILFFATNFIFAQPANDVCRYAVDISDGNWYSDNNINATLDCNEDHRTGHCGDYTTSGCNSGYEYTNAIDMCCGIEGIESSIWYTFTIPNDDTVYVDFRNISCNPVSFFGVTTTLQGFILRRMDTVTLYGCRRACFDTTKACFNAGNVNDIDGQMEAYLYAGVEYHIMIDTKKNDISPSSCGCPGDPLCHSECNWEIRIRQANPVLSLSDMKLENVEKGVRL